jgi:hypothetical protein
MNQGDNPQQEPQDIPAFSPKDIKDIEIKNLRTAIEASMGEGIEELVALSDGYARFIYEIPQLAMALTNRKLTELMGDDVGKLQAAPKPAPIAPLTSYERFQKLMRDAQKAIAASPVATNLKALPPETSEQSQEEVTA